MRSRFPAWFVVVVALCASCVTRDSDADLLRRISEVESRVLPKLDEWDGARGQEVEFEEDISSLLRCYARYANAHHGDSIAMRMLVKRAELLLGKGDAEAAAGQWLDIVEGGATPYLMPEALFRLGFIRETALGDTTGAMKAYAEVVRLFPESHWADMAADASKWLTFSEREFIRALEAGQGEVGR